MSSACRKPPQSAKRWVSPPPSTSRLSAIRNWPESSPGTTWEPTKPPRQDRSATTSSSSVAIAVGEEFFDITLPIQSFFDIAAHEVAYSYSLMFDERKDLYVGFGISVQDLALGIQGTESSPNPGEVINSQLASTAPLPTLNVGFNYAFNDQWFFVSRLGWLAVEIDFGADEDLSGQIINANAGIQWDAFKNVGFYLQYQLFDVDVDYTVGPALFAIDYDYNGPVLGVNVFF